MVSLFGGKVCFLKAAKIWILVSNSVCCSVSLIGIAKAVNNYKLLLSNYVLVLVILCSVFLDVF